MNYKVFSIISLMFLLLVGVVSASYDLELTTVTLTNPNIRAGDTAEFQVVVTNNGPDAFNESHTATIVLNFGDGMSEEAVIENKQIAHQATHQISVSHQYASKGAYSVAAEVTSALDTDDTNNIAEREISVINSVPVVTAISNQEIIEGREFTYSVEASDNDANDVLSYSIEGPAGMSISNSGFISGWIAEGVITSKTVTVLVSDGSVNATSTFSINVLADTPELQIVQNELLLGGSNQERDEVVEQVFTIKNTGTQTISNIALSVYETINKKILDSKYEATVQIEKTVLAPGEETNARLIALIPESMSARKTQFGVVFVEGTAPSQQYSLNKPVYMQAESKLEIYRVYISSTSEPDEVRISSGNTYEDFRPGDEITLRVEVENEYGRDDDFDIEDVEVIANGDDRYWDIEDETSSREDVRSNSKEDFIIDFTLPRDLDEETITVFLEATGYDREFGFEHFAEFDFDLKLERERDEISIYRWSWSKNVYSCADSTARLEVVVENTGEDDQREVTIEVVSDSSGINWHNRVRNIRLDADDRHTQVFTVPLSNVDEGSYFLNINTYYDNTEDSNSEIIVLEVLCNNGPSTDFENKPPSLGNDEDEDDDFKVDFEEKTPQDETFVYGDPISSKTSFRDSNTYVFVLGGLLFILLLVVIFLLVVFMQDKKKTSSRRKLR